jgi:hypothetical protein
VQQLFSLSKSTDLLWGTPSPLCGGYRGSLVAAA